MKNEEIVFAIVSSTLLILLLIAIIFIIFILSGKRASQQQIELAETKLAFEKELRQVEIEVSEQVMGQFAQELHDNIGQLLTAMHIQIENQKIDHPSLVKDFTPLEIYLEEVRQQLRLLSRTLNNDYLGHIGLKAAIEMEVERLNALKRFKTYLNLPKYNLNLNKEQELMIFRIFQEATQNILRHARASNVWITIQNTDNGQFELSIKDDGKGFDVAAILASPKASGIRNIIKRSKLAGLDCDIQSTIGQGSIYQLKAIDTDAK
jgi:signal transduction histidine kinase